LDGRNYELFLLKVIMLAGNLLNLIIPSLQEACLEQIKMSISFDKNLQNTTLILSDFSILAPSLSQTI